MRLWPIPAFLLLSFRGRKNLSEVSGVWFRHMMYSKNMSPIRASSQETSRDEMLMKLQTATDELITFYLSVSCPCAFPRFSFLTSFRGDEYTKSLLHTFETNVLIGASLRNTKFLTKDQQKNDLYLCQICATRYQYVYEQFSISFELVRLVAESNKAIRKGADIEFPFPLFGGIYLSDGVRKEEDIQKDLKILKEKFPRVSLDEFINYMMAGT